MSPTDISDAELRRRIHKIETTLGFTGMAQLEQFARQCGLDGAKSAVAASVQRYAKETSEPVENPMMLIEVLQPRIQAHGNQVLDYGMPGPGSL